MTTKISACRLNPSTAGGVANQLHPESQIIAEGSDRFGRAFEHFILNEVRAYISFKRLVHPISFWRTSSGFEVDLIVGDMDLAIECKSTREIRGIDLKGLRVLSDEVTPRRKIVVSRVKRRRMTDDGIEILPWWDFCAKLWDGKAI